MSHKINSIWRNSPLHYLTFSQEIFPREAHVAEPKLMDCCYQPIGIFWRSFDEDVYVARVSGITVVRDRERSHDDKVHFKCAQQLDKLFQILLRSEERRVGQECT